MVTIKAIDVMLQYGEKHYLTVRNVEVRGGLFEMDDGSVLECPSLEQVAEAVFKRVESVRYRKDVRLRFA